jgi:hypothetical protein
VRPAGLKRANVFLEFKILHESPRKPLPEIENYFSTSSSHHTHLTKKNPHFVRNLFGAPGRI